MEITGRQEQDARYPIGAVVARTGVPADVIRVWERRYGVPRPGRTRGGHRLYSERDIALLQRAAALRAHGLSASAACAQALQEQQEQEADRQRRGEPGPAAAERLCAQLRAAALALDAGAASAVLAEAAALFDVEMLWTHVIAPALAQVGHDWEDATATPAPEHLLSSLVRGRLMALLEATPRLAGARRAIVGAAPGERHDVAALMLALLLARAGWSVAFLGADTPVDAWDEATRRLRPRLVVITATLTQHAGPALETLARLHADYGPAVALACGGPAFARVSLTGSQARFIILLPDDVPAARQLLDTL